MRPGRVLRAGMLLVFALAAPAGGHSIVLESSPAAGATVAAPTRLSVRFNNRLERTFSRLRLVSERGEAQRLTAPAAEGPDDRLTVGVPPLAPGTYRVEWRVLSKDGHIVDGSFSFRVAP